MSVPTAEEGQWLCWNFLGVVGSTIVDQSCSNNHHHSHRHKFLNVQPVLAKRLRNSAPEVLSHAWRVVRIHYILYANVTPFAAAQLEHEPFVTRTTRIARLVGKEPLVYLIPSQSLAFGVYKCTVVCCCPRCTLTRVHGYWRRRRRTKSRWLHEASKSPAATLYVAARYSCRLVPHGLCADRPRLSASQRCSVHG